MMIFPQFAAIRRKTLQNATILPKTLQNATQNATICCMVIRWESFFGVKYFSDLTTQARCAPLITTTRHVTLTTPRGSTHPQAKFDICKSHPSDDDDDGDGVTGDDDDLATGNNGSRCACSFGSLCPASRSGHRRFGSRCALSGDGGRGGAAAHASLISRGVGPLTRRLALHAGATATTMATA